MLGRLVLGVIGVAMLAWLSIPNMSGGHESDSRYITGSIMKAREVVLALRIHVQDHDGALPATLDELIAEELIEPKHLSIDLLNGQPPVHWIYLKARKTPFAEVILISPPLSNDAGDFRRRLRGLLGQKQLPPKNPYRIVARFDAGVEALPERKFQWLVRQEGIVLPEATPALGQ